MLGIGQKFPQYALTGVVSSDLSNAFKPFNQDILLRRIQRHYRLQCLLEHVRQGIEIVCVVHAAANEEALAGFTVEHGQFRQPFGMSGGLPVIGDRLRRPGDGDLLIS